jgi:hypothetical protein
MIILERRRALAVVLYVHLHQCGELQRSKLWLEKFAFRI